MCRQRAVACMYFVVGRGLRCGGSQLDDVVLSAFVHLGCFTCIARRFYYDSVFVFLMKFWVSTEKL